MLTSSNDTQLSSRYSLFMSKRGVLSLAIAFLLLIPAISSSSQPHQTGATACYDTAGTAVTCADTLQDGDSRAGIAMPGERFQSNSDGTITDALTGLMWSDNGATSGSLTWQQALDYITTQNTLIPPYLGYSDWRLPNITELLSLLNPAPDNPAAWLALKGFSLPSNQHIWSSTTSPSAFDQAVALQPETGSASYQSKTGSGYVLPVRGPVAAGTLTLPKTGQSSCYSSSGSTVSCSSTGEDGDKQIGLNWPTPRFTAQDQQVTDSVTGLVWTQDANPMIQFNADFDIDGTQKDGAVTWQHALDFISSLNSLSYLGHQDWRLPNHNELYSLINFGVADTSFWLAGEGFTNLSPSPDFYWTSTTSVLSRGQAYSADLHSGKINSSPKMTTKSTLLNPGGYVWPVRSGQFGSSVLSFTPSAIDFGTVSAGGSQASRILSITNSSTKNQNLDINQLSLEGIDKSLFNLTSGGSNPCASLKPIIAPGTNCTLLLDFSPSDSGVKTASIKVVSNSSETAVSIPVTASSVDGTSPSGTLKINGGAFTTNSQNVTLTATASDNSGTVAEMRFSNDGVTWGNWLAYTGSAAWSLSPNDGLKTVYAGFRDEAGNISDSVSTVIFLKSSTPSDAVITGIPASGSTNTGTVILSISGIDTVSYRYILTPSSPIGATISPLQGTTAEIKTEIQLANLPEGDYSIEVFSRDIAGNEQPFATTASWSIDRTSPTLTVTPSTLVSPSNISTPTLGGTVELGVQSVSITAGSTLLGYASISGSNWSFTLSGLSEGANTISITARDNADNTTSIQRILVYDSTPPTALISGTPASSARSNSNKAILNIAGNDVVSYRYKLDSGDYSSETTVSQKVTLDSLSDGIHTINVIGKDQAGNWQNQSVATIYSWTIDTVAPSFVIAPPTTPTNGSNQNIVVNNISKVGAVITARNEASGSSSSITSTTGSVTFSAFPLQQGDNRITVTAFDSAGNSSASSILVTYDATAPTAVIGGNIANGSISLSKNAIFYISGTGVVSYLYKMDAGAFTTTPVDLATPVTLTGIPDGAHNLSVIGRDAAGNVQVNPTLLSWSIDSTSPSVTLSGGPQSVTSSTSANFTVTGAVTYKYALDAGVYSVETDVNTTISLSSISDGPHTLFVIGKDENSNWQTTPTTFSWKVKTTPPAVTITALPTPTNATKLTGTVEAGSTVSISMLNKSTNIITTGNAAVTGTAWSYTMSPATGTNYRATATATSSSGTLNSTSIDFLFDNTAPGITIAPAPAEPLPTAGTPSATSSYVFSVSAVETLSRFTYKLGSNPVSASFKPAEKILLTGLAAGSYSLSVDGYDLAGNKGTKSINWSVDATATPVSAQIDPMTLPPYKTNSTSVSLTILNNVSSYYIVFSEKPAGAVIAPAETINTPQTTPITVTTMPEGNYVLKVYGSIDGGATYQSYPTTVTWSVDRTPPASIELSGIPASGKTNATTLILTPSGDDLANYRYKMTSAPPGYLSTPSEDATTLISELVSFTNLPEGLYSIAIIGQDNAGNWQVAPVAGWETDVKTSLFSFSVDRTNPLVTINPPSSPTNSINQTVTGTVDDPNATVTISAGTTAEGGVASVNTATNPALWSFQLKGLVKGSNIITVTATDTAGNPGNSSVTISLTDDLPMALLSNTPVPVTSSNSANITVTGANGVVDYRYSIDGGAYSATTPINSAIALASLPEGGHILNVLGKDIAGNWQESPSTVRWTIDSIPPLASVTPSTPASPTNSATASFTIAGTDVIQYKYHLDSGADSNPFKISAPVAFSALESGDHTLYVYGSDQAGNWQSVPTTVSWTVETGKPQLLIDPASIASPVTASSIDISGSVTAASASVSITSVSAFNSATNLTTAGTLSGANFSITSLSLAETTNNITVTARDNAGNRISRAFSIVRNSTPPVVQILSGAPASQTNIRDISLTFGGIDVKAYRYRVDKDGVASGYSSDRDISQPLKLTSLADGRYDLYLTGKDSAGNWQDTASPTSLTWSIDTVPPTVTINSVTTPTKISGQRLTGSIEPGSGLKISNDRNSSGGTATVSGASWSYTISGVASGDNLITATATDPAGNQTTSTALINYDTETPTAVIYGTPSVITKETTAVIHVSGEGVATYTYSLDGGAPSSDVAVSLPINITGLSDGSHTLNVYGKKISGVAQTIPTAATWLIDTTPPVATITGAPSSSTSISSVDAEIGGTDVSSYRYALDGSPLSGETPAALKISTLNLAEGVHTLSVIAKDSIGNWQVIPTKATWSVDTIPPSLTINPVIERTTLTSQKITGSVEQGGSLSVSVNTGATASPPTVTAGSWSSTISALPMGENIITVTATDAAGNKSTQTARIIRYIPPFAALAGVPAAPVNITSINLTVSGEGVVAYKYSLDSAPYTPESSVSAPLALSSLSEGGHLLRVIGRDAANSWQSQPTEARITVDLTPPPGVDVSGTPASPTNKNSISLLISGSDVATYRYSLDNGVYSTFASTDTPLTITDIADGSHRLDILGKDLAGNIQESPTTILWTVDTVAPVTTPSKPGGVYSSALSITLSADEQATIRFTVDGTTPRDTSEVYSSPISITRDTVLKFYAVDISGNIEQIKTNTYSFASNGDVNGDGKIDVLDVIKALKHTVGILPLLTTEQISRADIAGGAGSLLTGPKPDSKVNSADVLAILKIVVRLLKF